jgi:hypothetical protein
MHLSVRGSRQKFYSIKEKRQVQIMTQNNVKIVFKGAQGTITLSAIKKNW